MIAVSNVEKTYASGSTAVHALRGVSLDIERGEFTAIAGPSGSGKTTLLNLIGCIDAITAGSIRFLDKDVGTLDRKALSALRREHIGFVFQNFNLIPVLSALENVAFALSIMGVKEQDARTRAAAALAQVGLNGMEDRRPGQLSGGQQQRVAIARALVKNPALVLADEPTANLDSRTGQEILELMKQLNREMGSTFLFSTHDKMVMDCSRRLVQLHDGLIVSDERRST